MSLFTSGKSGIGSGVVASPKVQGALSGPKRPVGHTTCAQIWVLGSSTEGRQYSLYRMIGSHEIAFGSTGLSDMISKSKASAWMSGLPFVSGFDELRLSIDAVTDIGPSRFSMLTSPTKSGASFVSKTTNGDV